MGAVREGGLADAGRRKIAWAASFMPVLAGLREEFVRTQPFSNLRISLSIHLEAKTACFALALRDGGAAVAATGCNPLSTQDDVAAGLRAEGIEVHALRGADPETYARHLAGALAFGPHLALDDGGDLTALLHGACADRAGDLIGLTEETTTGVRRARARAEAGRLRFPLLAVNDADCKHLFDNRYGTGQSTWAAILHTTNVQVTGNVVVVAGYGWCGRGVARRAAGLGARVIVTEIDPVKAIEAAMDGHTVMTMDEAAPHGDFFITVTGCRRVITGRHMARMKDGAILANAGHFDVEIDLADLAGLAARYETRRAGVTGYFLPDGRVLNLLAEGRLVNLAAGDGHPAEIMDMSFSVQALALRHLVRHGRALTPGVYSVPRAVDEEVAARKLRAAGLSVDTLTPEQRAYLDQF
ncbi:MAG: adenosylhomocysteinase [Oscillospiraceae bacterium]|jgi:adenosylhomocysteinase|nr:adenosylhomocysteinase [Oscillospiraceae bacterium]